MEMSYFWEFLVLSEIKNYSAAAFQMSMSESSLSRHIKALEYELCAQLFDRNTRSLELTDYGRALVPYAKQIMQIQGQYTAEFRKIDQLKKDALMISTCYNVRPLLHQFSEAYPNITCTLNTFQMDVYEMRWQIDRLRHHQDDVAFVLYDPQTVLSEYDDIAFIPFTVDEYVVIMGLDHPLASKPDFVLKDLKYEDFITFNTSGHESDAIVKICQDAGFEPNIICTVKSGENVASLVKYHGVSFLLRKLVERDTFDGICYRIPNPRLTVDIRVCYLKSASSSPAVSGFINYIQNEWFTISGQKDTE